MTVDHYGACIITQLHLLNCSDPISFGRVANVNGGKCYTGLNGVFMAPIAELADAMRHKHADGQIPVPRAVSRLLFQRASVTIVNICLYSEFPAFTNRPLHVHLYINK